MSKRTMVLIAVAAFILTLSLVLARSRGSSAAPAAAVAQASRAPNLIAGPGRVEPLSEDIKLGSELSGKLKLVEGSLIAEAVYQKRTECAHIVDGQAVICRPLLQIDYRSYSRIEMTTGCSPSLTGARTCPSVAR